MYLIVDVQNSRVVRQTLRSRNRDLDTASKAKVAMIVKQRVTKTVNCEPRQNCEPIQKF